MAEGEAVGWALPASQRHASPMALMNYSDIRVRTWPFFTPLLGVAFSLGVATTAHAAGPGESCVLHADCTDPGAARCSGSPLVCSPCEYDEHCSSVAGRPYCTTGVCVECQSDAQCSAAQTGYAFDGCQSYNCVYLVDTDNDGTANVDDEDDDSDGVLDSKDNAPLDPLGCTDLDSDGCDDCSQGAGQSIASDGPDADGDGICDSGDDDDDNDGVLDVDDVDPVDPTVCTDDDGDQCDDCSLGLHSTSDDGPDRDGDGLCDSGDPDDDNDGVSDDIDWAPLDPTRCRDADDDGCDDCAGGNGALPNRDGADQDSDGQCDAGDPDDDNDGVLDASDVASLDPRRCADFDNDGCDDCSAGNGVSIFDDGPDADGDGRCDSGDADADNDGVANAADIAPTDPGRCSDLDDDGCDDCSLGSAAMPDYDGVDSDRDGLCDLGDTDDDNDGVADEDDPAPLDDRRCGDEDEDGCDDCFQGQGSHPEDDGADTDGDGVCDLGDDDDDGDGVADADDPAPLSPVYCGDTDRDLCDDCSQGQGQAPNADGVDTNGDGVCDAADDDDDGDLVPDGDDVAPKDPKSCRDADQDGCDDCSQGAGANPRADGTDSDGDGMCDDGDETPFGEAPDNSNHPPMVDAGSVTLAPDASGSTDAGSARRPEPTAPEDPASESAGSLGSAEDDEDRPGANPGPIHLPENAPAISLDGGVPDPWALAQDELLARFADGGTVPIRFDASALDIDPISVAGCSCRTASAPPLSPRATWGLLAVLALAGVRRRRPRRGPSCYSTRP